MAVSDLGPPIDEVLAAVTAWNGREVSAERISGGLTNRNYRVSVDGTPYFLRIPGEATELLAVDRGNELHNTRAAAAAGAGPVVVDHLPAFNVIVLAWLDARTMSNEAFAVPGMPSRIAAVLHRLHAGPRFRDDFDMFRLTERYLRLIDERAIPLPAGYRDGIAALSRVEAAMRVRPLASVPCHNDLLAENYLDDGERLWIVDYEYSGNNDPTFELGNTAQELGFDDDRLRELCAAYFGEVTAALVARCKLQMLMSDIGWTLWAAIQSRISPIEYDFFGWAEERWARARERLSSPDLEGWLRAVAV